MTIDALLLPTVYAVSIHTPTKGVTPRRIAVKRRQYVSIHTPTKGVTINQYYDQMRYKVSIHTPTKGVTQNLHYLYQTYLSFNPHTHEGCDYRKQWI